MKRYRFQSRGKIRPDVSVVLQDVGFPFSHSYSSQREWQRWREEAKSGEEMVEVVERENVGITFGRRIMFMLRSSYTERQPREGAARIKEGLDRNSSRWLVAQVHIYKNALEDISSL